MRSSAVLFAATAAALAPAGDNRWIAPLATDRRSPCPMVNTLANHGFLARDGFNVSMDQLKAAFADAVHLDPVATQLVGAVALTGSTTGHADTFHLDDLNKHGVIEHDGSLSRADTFTGDAHTFDAAVWANTASHFAEETISIATAATARAAAVSRAAAANPDFDMTEADTKNSLIESALYLSVFGSPVDGNAVTRQVRVLFEEERLPYAEGFARSASQITAQNILGLVNKIAAVKV